jgi:hypothetical protein
MNRTVCKFGLAAALVLGVLAFSPAPAQAQVYVSGYYGTPTYTYSYYPSTYYYGYPSYYYTPAYSSYYYAPAYSYYPYGGVSVGVGWGDGWYRRGWYGDRGWYGRRWWWR